MTNLLCIVHSSEVIRRGLYTILSEASEARIIQLAGLNEVLSYLSDSINLTIIGTFETAMEEDLHLLKDKATVRFIHIGISNPPPNIIGLIHLVLNMNDSGETITRSITGLLSKANAKVNSDDNKLTSREIDVLKLLVRGMTSKEIADALCISIHTVISHRKNISEKLGIKSISGLTVYAVLNKIIDNNLLQ